MNIGVVDMAAVIAASMVLVGIWLLVMAFFITVHWLIYAKAGQPGWAVLIPIYNFLVLLRIVGRPWWWLFFILQIFLFEIVYFLSPGIVTGTLFAVSVI